MSKYDKLFLHVLRGNADAGVEFEDIRKLLLWLGFEERVRGSHHIFRKEGVEEKINLQRDGKHAKPYQVRQVRTMIINNNLGGDDDRNEQQV